MREPLPTAVEIVQTPEGEAPLWVREAWVGLELPLTEPTGVQRFRFAVGVLTAPTSWLGMIWALLLGRLKTVDGYPVPSAEAIALLAARRPDAARWWHESAGHFTEEGMTFVFDAPACRPVFGPQGPWGPRG